MLYLNPLVFVAANLKNPVVVVQGGYNGTIIGELNCKKTNRVWSKNRIQFR